MHKIAFELGPFTVHWYGILVALGFLAGLWTASRRGLKEGFSPETIVDLGPWILLGAIVGARILYVVSYWREQFAQQPWKEIFMVQHGGVVFYGGLIGAILVTLGYTRYKKLPPWKLGDVLAPSIALGQAFGRVGCLMTGCCFGRPTSLPWAIHFPLDHETHGIGVHPTQLYSSLSNFGLYLGLAWLYRHKKFDGQVFATYLICYSVLRFLVEMFRGDYPVYYAGFFTPGQLVSGGILVVGLLLFWKLPRPARQTA